MFRFCLNGGTKIAEYHMCTCYLDVFILRRYAQIVQCIEKRCDMPKLKLKMESILHMFLTDELTDVGFKEACQALLNEFEGKNLLHQNIGQLTWEMEKKNPSKRNRFKKIWILLDQGSPRIREDFDRRMENGPNRKST